MEGCLLVTMIGLPQVDLFHWHKLQYSQWQGPHLQSLRGLEGLRARDSSTCVQVLNLQSLLFKALACPCQKLARDPPSTTWLSPRHQTTKTSSLVPQVGSIKTWKVLREKSLILNNRILQFPAHFSIWAANCQESNPGLLQNFQPSWPISQTLRWKNTSFICIWNHSVL